MVRGKGSKIRTSTDALSEVLEEYHLALVKDILSSKHNQNLLQLQIPELGSIELHVQNILTKIIQIRFLEDLQFITGKPLTQHFVEWDNQKTKKNPIKTLMAIIKQHLHPFGLWTENDEIITEIHIKKYIMYEVLDELTRIVCNESFLENIVKISENYLAHSSIITKGKLSYQYCFR